MRNHMISLHKELKIDLRYSQVISSFHLQCCVSNFSVTHNKKYIFCHKTELTLMMCNAMGILYFIMCHFKCSLPPTNFTAWSMDGIITQFEKHWLGRIQGWLACSVPNCLRTHWGQGRRKGEARVSEILLCLHSIQFSVSLLLNINEAIVSRNPSTRNMILECFPWVHL